MIARLLVALPIVVATHLRAQARVPTVTGPIPVTAPAGDPSHNYPFGSTRQWLTPFDYVEDEFYIEGRAAVYTADGQSTAAVGSDGPYPYKTRVMVRRPRLSARFTGTVLVEWINVSGGQDQENEWYWSHEHLMRAGYAHVGVSAQPLGINAADGLRNWNPSRYGSLDVNAGGKFTFQLSNDVFTQVARALKQPAGARPLGGLRVKNVIASGHSSSAARLAFYYNSIHPLIRAIDGFVLHSVGTEPVRTDVPTPVWKLLAESDGTPISQDAGPQADGRFLRTWQIAGAAHAGRDLIEPLNTLFARDFPSRVFADTCERPMLSEVPVHVVLSAVYDGMKQWIERGTAPPHAPRVTLARTNGEGPRVIARDQYGNARGGIRLAHVDVPIATNTGTNGGSRFCRIYGSHVMFDDSTLARLYPTHEKYVAEVTRVTNANLKAGYITKDGADEIIAEAKRAAIGRRPQR